MNRSATRSGLPAFLNAPPRKRAAVPMKAWMMAHDEKPRAPFWRRLIGRV